MDRSRFAVLVMACASCGGQVTSAADAGTSADVDDGGIACSAPSVVVDCTSLTGSTSTVGCTTDAGRLIAIGECFEGTFKVRCLTDGDERDFAESQRCDCGNPASFVPPVHQCVE